MTKNLANDGLQSKLVGLICDKSKLSIAGRGFDLLLLSPSVLEEEAVAVLEFELLLVLLLLLALLLLLFLLLL
jgi:hypothetical protein